MPDKSTYLTTEQAAELLNVHPNTILRWIKAGKLPTTQIGKQYRIPREAIENRVGKVGSGTRVIAVANQKGGVAKTTTTLNLAAGLGKQKKKVLVTDLDPQGGCAVSLGISTDSLNKTVYTVLMNEDAGFKDIIIKTSHGFDLAPSNIDLAGAEIELKQLLAAEQILKNKLEDVIDDYDYVLLDCPPSLGMLTINALTAAHEILIPMSMEFLALRGLNMLAKTVSKVRAITNPEITYLGILATKYDRRTLNSREIFEALQHASNNAGIRMFISWARGPKRSHVRLIDLVPAGGEGGSDAAADGLLARLDALERERAPAAMPFNVGDRVTVVARPENGVGRVVAFSHFVGDPNPDRVIVRFGEGPAVHYLPGDLALAPAEDETQEHGPDDASARLMVKACLWCGGRGCVLCS